MTDNQYAAAEREASQYLAGSVMELHKELDACRAENKRLRARLELIAINARGQVNAQPPGRHPSDTWLWQQILATATTP